MDTCLWGNATDLSLLTSLTHEELQALQSTERGANFVLKDDSEAVWEHLRKVGKGRIDIVLDNVSELYLIQALNLLLIHLSLVGIRALYRSGSCRLVHHSFALLHRSGLPPQAHSVVCLRRVRSSSPLHETSFKAQPVLLFPRFTNEPTECPTILALSSLPFSPPTFSPRKTGKRLQQEIKVN